jgi:hypothetical protein
VIVVAGVGDKPRSDAAEAVANGLVRHAGFTPPDEYSEWFDVPGDRIRQVQRFSTRRPPDTEVDLYEFWWADLSRFPAALRSFLAAFVGLFLAFPSIGRTALRDNSEITAEPQAQPTSLAKKIDYHLIGVLAWLVAVPVVVLTATLLMTTGALVVALTLPDANSITGAISLALYGAVLAVVGLWLLRRYQENSDRRPAFWLGVASLLAAVGVCAWRLVERGAHGRSIELALADTVAEFVAYPLRIVWLAVLAIAFAAAVVLVLKIRRNGRDRTVSAVSTLGFGPLGIATLMAIFSAAIGAAGEKVGRAAVWAADAQPLCLERPADWSLGACTSTPTSWDFGSHLLADSIYSLACAGVVVGGAVLVLVLAMLASAAPALLRRTPEGRASAITRMLGVLESPLACTLLLVTALAASYAAAGAWLSFFPLVPHPGEGKTSWGPTVAAILGGAITTLLLAARLLGLSPQRLAANGAAPGPLRTMLDKAYDIATFLREPMGHHYFGSGLTRPLPRQRMLERYRALMRHVALPEHGYQRVVFVAHSQGTVLTATLLAENVDLPGEVSLLTFGCPLRQLYLRRFPSQYGWIEKLEDPATRRMFVKFVDREWVNVAAPSDPVGRTVFAEPPQPWVPGPVAQAPGVPALAEHLLDKGGHGVYWDDPLVYHELARLIS